MTDSSSTSSDWADLAGDSEDEPLDVADDSEGAGAAGFLALAPGAPFRDFEGMS